MKNHVFDLVSILSLYVVMAISYYGWGRLGAAMLKLNVPASRTPFTITWLGWTITLLLLQICHLFFPLDLQASLLVYGVGGMLSLPLFFGMLRKFVDILTVHRLLYALLLLLVASWIASRSMLPPTNYDSGLYHFNAIRWINLYHIIPGLGNLHGRLAFNHSFFVYAASLNFFPYFSHSRSVANSFLFLLLFSEVTWQLLAFVSQWSISQNPHPFLYVPHLFILPILGYLAITSNGLTSPTPDLALTLIQLYIFITFVRTVYDIRNRKWLDNRAVVLIILAITAITIKLSNLAFSISIISVCFFCLYLFCSDRRLLFHKIVRLAILSAIILIIWEIRGIILSGYPLYPSTIAGISVDWAMPLEKVRDEANWVYSWARLPGVHWSKILGNWDWLGPWFRRVSHDIVGVVYPTISALFVMVFVLVLLLFSFRKEKPLPRLFDFLLLLPVVIGLIFWFFTAPDPRFAHALFWLLPLGLVLVLLSYLYLQFSFDTYSFTLVVCGVFLVMNVHFLFYGILNRDRINVISTTGSHAMKTVPLIQKRTLSGLIVYTPEKGDQCWDSPIPCTPYFDPHLRLRMSGRVESGFTVR